MMMLTFVRSKRLGPTCSSMLGMQLVDGYMYTLWLQEKHPDMDYERKEYAIREEHGNSSYLSNSMARDFRRLYDGHEKFYRDDIWFIF